MTRFTDLESANPFDVETQADTPEWLGRKRAKKRAMLNALLVSVIEKGDAAEKEFRRAFKKWDKLRADEAAIIRKLSKLDLEDVPAMLKPQAQ